MTPTKALIEPIKFGFFCVLKTSYCNSRTACLTHNTSRSNHGLSRRPFQPCALSPETRSSGCYRYGEYAQFDPDTATIDTCTIPPYQTEGDEYVPPDADALCPVILGTGPVSDEIQQDLAERYAPVLFFHPLEEYTMQSVDATFADPARGKVFFDAACTEEVYADTLNQRLVLETVTDLDLALNNNLYSFGHDQTSSYRAGAGFDETTGLSHAPVYYNVIEYSARAVVIYYHFYYTYHDSATFGVLGSYNQSDTYYVNFRTAPFGAHEGDWQGMSVVVCKNAETDVATGAISAQQPLSVAYKQYLARQVTDGTTAECTLYKDTVRPVGFVARGKHSTYPVASNNLVYNELDVEFFVNLQGILAVDKTNYKASNGSYRMFMANDTNVVKHERPVYVTADSVTESQYWQGFGGKWGCTCQITDLGLGIDYDNPGPSECFSANGTEYAACPEDTSDNMVQVFFLVNKMLGVLDIDGETILDNPRTFLGDDQRYFVGKSVRTSHLSRV